MTEPNGQTVGALVIVGKNGGKLRNGGPTNVGGRGYIKEKLRTKAARSFAKRLKILGNIADGWTRWQVQEECPQCGWVAPIKDRVTIQTRVAARDQLTAIDMLGKYGVGGVKTAPPPPEANPAEETRQAAFDALATSEKIVKIFERAAERKLAVDNPTTQK